MKYVGFVTTGTMLLLLLFSTQTTQAQENNSNTANSLASLMKKVRFNTSFWITKT